MNCTFVRARISKLETLIDATDDAILALTIGGVQEYTLDTGQTIQRVTQIDVPRLNETVDMLLNRLEVLCARCPQNSDERGVVIARAAKYTNYRGGC